jgi:hypothetical protein
MLRISYKASLNNKLRLVLIYSKMNRLRYPHIIFTNKSSAKTVNCYILLTHLAFPWLPLNAITFF